MRSPITDTSLEEGQILNSLPIHFSNSVNRIQSLGILFLAFILFHLLFLTFFRGVCFNTKRRRRGLVSRPKSKYGFQRNEHGSRDIVYSDVSKDPFLLTIMKNRTELLAYKEQKKPELQKD
jgi:hypothetical protein